MTSPVRIGVAIILAVLVLVVGYRAIVTAGAAPVPSMDGLEPREVLRTAPLEALPFVALAAAGDSTGVEPLALHRIVARRAPRNLLSRAWLADYSLGTGQYTQALDHVDVMLRLSQRAGRELLPLMVRWAADPEFADVLVDRLRTDPPWRAAMLVALGRSVDSPATSTIFAALRDSGDLQDAERRRWLDALMRAGHWGRAYAHWVGSRDRPRGEAIPMLHDGGFDQPVANEAFGWRIGNGSGTYTEIGPADGAAGPAARMVFLGRQVAAANLEQPLLLPPGAYRLRIRMKAQALRSDQGLEWTLTCNGRKSRPFAKSSRVEGSFDWHQESFEFTVPREQCAGQWLRLENPAPPGSSSLVSGTLWADDFQLDAPP